MQPYYSQDGISIYHGDCLEIAPTLSGVSAVVTDPPYGIGHDTNYGRFTGGLSASRNWPMPVAGDDKAFDPAPWLNYSKVILFGYNCFADRLPIGSLLVWCKRRDNQLGTFMSDCEVAWMKGGHGVYLFQHVWHGFDRATERDQAIFHPTQKPVAVMQWVIGKQQLSDGGTVLDPYMGSGSTLIAARALGLKAIGIELEERYCEIAARRLCQQTLFTATSEPESVQAGLFDGSAA